MLSGCRPATGTAAEELDATDPIAFLRDRFALPDGVVHLDGNSLGARPVSAEQRLAIAVRDEWGTGLIRSWNDAGWYTEPARVAAGIASLLGAHADEVAVADSTSINLFKLLVAGARLRPGRTAIVVSDHDFPTDRYLAESTAELLGLELRAVAGPDAATDALDDDVAVLALCHVDFRTGAIADAPGLTAAAHDVGALALWDLSHSTGALDVDLAGWGADLAVGCGYKYLNGGPGAPAYAYAAREHHAGLRNPLPGWFAHADPFAFDPRFTSAPGLGRLACGTPPLLSLLGLAEGVASLRGVTPAQLAAKARGLTGLFVELVDRYCPEVDVASPRDAAIRGSQVALRHADAYPLAQALAARGVIGDFRAPDLARFGFAPAYIRYVDVVDAVATLRAVLDGDDLGRPDFTVRTAVT
ncbi:aminotransferase class V-fold PLP-dependent enzyme [Pseudonocardia sp. H11422]|uniref:aminotransferase class V-fold PLP-dependent enzyme n=1 Tax=Pseudonocardia sp. H11422 TaxID=2835866 RepID=UPI001BDD42E4|nr:aminotransferase class V-fold PLP-dependent enzyme [Pseudonocardia sp. H11422]